MSNKNKWSPAPWKFTPPGPADANGYGVCALWGEPGSDEQIANSHLIAAAPEMYEMIVDLRHAISMAGINHPVDNVEVLNSIDKLLAKARGETA